MKFKRIQIYLFFLLIFSNIYPNSGDKQFVYFTQGNTAQLVGNFHQALYAFSNSFIEAKKNGDKITECKSLAAQAIIYWNIGQIDSSKDKYLQALDIANEINLKDMIQNCEISLKIWNFYSEGKQNRRQGMLEKSNESFQKAIDFSQDIGSKEHELKCLRQMSPNYLEDNNLERFYSLNIKGLELAKSLNHRREIGKFSINIGLFFEKTDDYYEALNYYEEALKISREFKNEIDISACLNNIGNIYRSIGEFDKSLHYSLQALEIDRLLKNDYYECIDLNNLGITYKLKGIKSDQIEDFNQALLYYNDALILSTKLQDQKTEIRILNNIGSLLNHLNKPEDALEHFLKSSQIAEKINDIEAMGMILNNLGIIYYNQGDYEESNKYYQRAIDLALEYQGGPVLWEAYLERAKALEKQEKLTEAIDSYKNSISIIEDIRSQIKLEEHKASFLGTDKRIEAYQNLIQLLAALHNTYPDLKYGEEAFLYLERGKARAFLDSLEISQVDISQGIDPKLLNEEKDLMRNISNVYNKLLAAVLSTDEKSNIQEQLRNYEHELQVLKREIRTKSPAYADLKYPEIVTLDEAQRLLDNKTAFFAYSFGPEKAHAFVITKDNLKTFTIPSRNELKQEVSEYLKTISDRDSSDFSLGYSLYSKLILPGLEKQIKRIIVIPDEFLNFLPFETLVTSKTEPHWLLENLQMAYAPSITSLREIIIHKRESGAKRPMDIMAVGDPDFSSASGGLSVSNLRDFFSSNTFSLDRLEYSGTEVEKVSSLFKSNKRETYLRDLATEDQLKRLDLKDYKIVHFATHSLIDNEKPARSSILLTLDDNPDEDGFLQMREIYNLSFNADLVTLSACQTGLGQLIKGEGIQGINRAFFYAGASSVLMSLWPVNDQATYQLMERFYSHLRKNESIESALRKAKLELISSDVLSHPFYWAAFISSGKADQVIFAKAGMLAPLLAVSFLLLGGIVFVAVRKNNNH